jgi:dCMP deaminase
LNTCSDARGNFLITLEDEQIKVVLTHPETGAELEKFYGKNALELKDKISQRAYELQTSHAIDVGTELMKAEFCLKNRIEYEQDKRLEELGFEKKAERENFFEDKKKVNRLEENKIGSRPTWDEYYMKIAIGLSSRSSCIKVHSGSVIVHGNRVIGSGYNGAPPGIRSCLEKGFCTKEYRTGKDYEKTLNTGQCIGVHSEMNALANTNTTVHKGFTLYTTILPCHVCAKTLIAHGIKRVVFKKMYDEEEAKRVIDLFIEAGIQVDELDLSPERLIDIDFGYRKLTFDVWSEEEKEKIKDLLG